MGTDHEAVLGAVETTLDRVDAALGRLADGSYGVCTVCGDRISEDLLVESPTADVCGRH
ncbi:MAG: TraR/DksA family transcriptional regulator [Acidimicrobiales bacterium]